MIKRIDPDKDGYWEVLENIMEKGVFESESAKIVEISKEFGAEKVFLFGSCVEDIKTARDIDIAVKGVNHEV